MHEKLRIHHGVGSRVLFDSDQQQASFTYGQTPNGWKFSIHIERNAAVEEVLRLKHEINLFIFREEQGAAAEKIWFYTGDGTILYDEKENRLEITATRHISYHPNDFHTA